MKIVIKDIFLRLQLYTLRNYMVNIKIYHFYLIKKRLINAKKLICSIYGKEKYVVHIRTLKQALKYGLELEKMHRAIEFNQKASLKPYIDLNTELRKNANNESDKNFFKLMNNPVFGKTMENVRNYGDIKLARTNKRRKQLVSEPNYHSTKYFSEDLIAMELIKLT